MPTCCPPIFSGSFGILNHRSAHILECWGKISNHQVWPNSWAFEMALQRNIAQQNAETKAKVRRVADIFATRPSHLAWLGTLLVSHGLNPSSGILVSLSEIPEQEGHLFSGVWLCQSEEFWEFEVVLSRTSGELLSAERFENTTGSVSVSQVLKGQGKPFGRIAIEVLREASA